jgi:hypothetical protein
MRLRGSTHNGDCGAGRSVTAGAAGVKAAGRTLVTGVSGQLGRRVRAMPASLRTFAGMPSSRKAV